jgi:putative endonuclease
MAFVYILYSKKINRYYTGSCLDVDKRLQEHNSQKYQNTFTAQSNDWTIYYSISCDNHSTALKIEKHIKKMKSRKYIENLKLFPEISLKLISKYKEK